MKRRILRVILVVDGLLVLVVLGLLIADQVSSVLCTPTHFYSTCSVYFKLSYPAEILLLTWGIGTLPVALVNFGDWLGAALQRLRRTNADHNHPDV
jgi:hypothetical protein